MSEYLVPFEDSESEFVEKRSRFIGCVWRVESEAEARAKIEATKKNSDFHNCVFPFCCDVLCIHYITTKRTNLSLMFAALSLKKIN